MCHALTCSSKNPIVYSGVTAPNHLVAAPTFPVKTARNRGGLLVVICFLWAVVYLSVLLTEVNAESLGDFQAEGRIAVEVPRLPSANRSDDRFSVCRSGRFSIATLTGAATVVFVNDGMDSFTLRIPSDPQIPHAQLFISPGWAFGDSIYAFLAAETAFGTGNGMLSTNWLKKLPFLSSEVFPAADIQVRIVQLKPEQQSIDSQEIVIFGPARWKGKDDEWVQNSPPFEEGRPVASIRISHAQKSTIPANDKIVSSIVLKHLVPVQDALSDRRTEIFQQWIAELGAKREPPAASFMSNYLTIHQRTLVTDWRFGEESYQYFIGTNSPLPMRDGQNFEAISESFNDFMREKKPRYGAFWSFVGAFASFSVLLLLLLPFIKKQQNPKNII